MSASTAAFRAAIDRAHEATRSVVLRYRNVFRFGPAEREDVRFKDLLSRTSIREGVRLVPLGDYRGVSVSVLDQSSAMHTGTLKSIDGCVTIARCLEQGFGRVAFESGGNTGRALAEYGASAGLETFCFVPAENLGLLDSATFRRPGAHLIAVGDPGMVRSAAERFTTLFGVARVPRAQWRIEASRFLGCFLLESLLDGAHFDYLVQTISAGFAPIGIYEVLAQHGRGDAASGAPRFLGIQQAENCAMFQAWRSRSSEITTPPVRSTASLLSPVMYDSEPQKYGTYPRLDTVLESSGGALTTLDAREFAAVLDEDAIGGDLLDRLAEQGIEITRRGGAILERTGIIALVGALREIEQGRIPRGSSVLCCLTSGTGHSDGEAVAEVAVDDLDALAREARARWFPRAMHA
jgi:threonine synthase